ncbi:uncharacterized protein B0T23DRAFT_379402 [Neurospora hispaniola]|uniref:Uncharacterized protein n=1 Tax=Neurospora hispaniola TaxID=588809 RepID=A0AAJ0MRK1_9PEZI|nr:hypothetical protein B0T23DRAFT_379402 [Neurospora hispaniola]
MDCCGIICQFAAALQDAMLPPPHRPSAAYPAGLIDPTSRQTNHFDYLACDGLSFHTLSHRRQTYCEISRHTRAWECHLAGAGVWTMWDGDANAL